MKWKIFKRRSEDPEKAWVRFGSYEGSSVEVEAKLSELAGSNGSARAVAETESGKIEVLVMRSYRATVRTSKG